MKILLAVDGSPVSRKMLVYVASNEKWFRPEYEYVLLHVASSAGKLSPPGSPGRSCLDEASSFLHSQVGFDAVKVGRVGNPVTVIPDYARRQACSLIVMGSHGHGRIEALMVGSVTQGVLATSHVPVLVVR